MTEEHSLAELLEWPFPPALIEQVDKGYGKFSYVPGAEVIVRLNKVLGVGNWGMTVDSLERHEDWLIARVTLSAWIEGRECHYGAADGHKLEKDWGDCAKSAVTNAMKKAATLLGIGLYLSRSPEALRYEQEKKKKTEAAS